MSRTYKSGGKFCTSDKIGKKRSNRRYRKAVSNKIGDYVSMAMIPDAIDEDGNLLPQIETNLPQVAEIYDVWADLPSEGIRHRYNRPSRWLAKAI